MPCEKTLVYYGLAPHHGFLPHPATDCNYGTVDTSRKNMTEGIEVKLRNQKKEAVTVVVKENLYRWVNWQIAAKTHDFEKQDARTVHFPVKVAAGGEATLRYTVHYTW